METVLFLLLVAVFVAVLLWAMSRSKNRIDLAPRKPKAPKRDPLSTPSDTLLAHKRQMWEARRKGGHREFESQPFVPKFEQRKEPEYDGYSRRGRHHLSPAAKVSEKTIREPEDEFTMSSIRFSQDTGGTPGPAKN